MPKSLTVDPASVRARGSVTVPEIPINAYTMDFAA